jgi:hypothetical protein
MKLATECFQLQALILAALSLLLNQIPIIVFEWLEFWSYYIYLFISV